LPSADSASACALPPACAAAGAGAGTAASGTSIASPASGTGGGAVPIAITAGALSFNSLTTRCAVLAPTPLAAVIALQSPMAMARLTPSGPSAPRIASAAFAPTPCTLISRRCHSFSASVGNPKSCNRSSRTRRSV